MVLTRKQFQILTFLEQTQSEASQRRISAETKMSLGSVNNILLQLTDLGHVKAGRITNNGLNALEPHRARRAVFIASGFGSRLVPVTLNTPKPLIRVKGVRIIDTLLDAVVAAGIREIVLVRGYLSEQFDQLLYKYPNIQFLENPVYNETNNISSAMCARHLFKNAYVFDSDLLLYNSALIAKYQYKSNYLGVPVEKTDDWCLECKNGIITKMASGGINCYQMYGVSYWTEEDGTKLAKHIKQLYEMPGGKERYWDQIALDYFIKDYNVEVRECAFDDIIEVDTFSELKKLDETYRL